jgi:flavin-dependent dehydrogenase
VRRTALHAALAARVLEVEVPVRRSRVLDLVQDGARVQLATDDGPVRGRWVLGCDGLHSTVRRAAGLEVVAGRPGRAGRPGPRRAARFGVRRHAAVAPWSSRVEVHWGRDVEGYVTPVGPGEVGVAVLGPRGTSFEAGLAQLPGLAERLQGAGWTTTARGAGPLLQRARGVASGRVLLAGDAAGYVDALTGEGLRVGLAAAEAAVGALTTGRSRWVADAYERTWRRETRSFRVVTAALLAASRPAPLRAALVPLAALAPPAFGAVVDRLAQ